MIRKIYKLLILPHTLFLVYLMFLGLGRTQMLDNELRAIPFRSTYWLIIEYYDTHNYPGIIANLLGNIIMFMPFGFLGWLFPALKNFRILSVWFFPFLIGAETLQYLTRLGIFDVDDLILNMLGLTLGFLLMKKYDKICPEKSKINKDL